MTQTQSCVVVIRLAEKCEYESRHGCFRERHPDLEGIDPANPGSNR